MRKKRHIKLLAGAGAALLALLSAVSTPIITVNPSAPPETTTITVRPKAHIEAINSHSDQEIATEYKKETPKRAEQPKPTIEPGWVLDIPSIGLHQQMTQVIAEGRTLPVPDNNPGYYLSQSGNIFIIGHNSTVFTRLHEIPGELSIIIDGAKTTYHLDTYENTPKDNVDMHKVTTYRGVSVMTCSGERVGDTLSHRLILYYH